MLGADRQSLRRAIEQLQQQIARLDRQRAEARQRLVRLEAELAATSSPPSAHATPASPQSTRDKLALFRALFRGRADVFPRRWHNRKTGRTGYSPACANEWAAALCHKPKVRCGDCPHQAFVPLTDQVVLDHLRGQHVIGLYPMLLDETCWLLAMDFDNGDWQQDVLEVAQTCNELDVPLAVERSRSGRGAHLWFFFAEPVPAATARQMGCALLTRTMERRPQLPLNSYDRLFPNQDTLPRGGFGNLIALPFQDGPRHEGNSVFVDRRWEPFDDQWAFLAGCRRMEPAEVARLAHGAARGGQLLAVSGRTTEDGADVPHTRAGGRQQRVSLSDNLVGPLPASVRAVLKQRMLVERTALPAALQHQIRRLATFQNPEFHKRQALRLSTARTSMVIDRSEMLERHVALPRGCLAEVQALLSEHGVALELRDQRSEGEPLELRFHGTLRPEQERAARALLAHETGVFVAPPGTGKTVVGAYLAAARGRSTLVLVHRTQLLEQWRTQLALFLDLKPQDVGQIGGGKRKPTGRLDVAMLQSLCRGDDMAELVQGYGHVMVDECHHVPAVGFERVMRGVTARYVTGLTATPRRKDGHHPILHYELGPVRFELDPREQASARPFVHRLVLRETLFRPSPDAAPADSRAGGPGIQALYSQLAQDEARNQQILDDVMQALQQGRSPLVLTERREHLEQLAQRLAPFARHMVVLRGGMGVRQRREVQQQLAAIPDHEERLMLATGRFIGEGFDDARLVREESVLVTHCYEALQLNRLPLPRRT